MNRRTFLRAGGMVVGGLGLTSCAARQARLRRPGRRRIRVNIVPVEASWDRVIGTTVGLRPHRPSGFVVKAEKLDAKTILHNYGHGGAGLSLSWGTGRLVADMAMDHTERRAAVLGAGAVGLTAARQLQRRGFSVTIYAMAVPPNTTSNMALAGFTPTSGLIAVGKRTPQWDEQFRFAAEIAYRQLQLLVGRGYGVSWINAYATMDELPPAERKRSPSALLPQHLRTGRVILYPGEHPFPLKYATRRPTIRIEPAIYLDALVRDVLVFGGRIVIRKFDTRRDLMSLDESLIVNCTGLGSRELFDDQKLIPVKGQLTLLVPQPDVNYRTWGGIRSNAEGLGMGIHMTPRSDAIALGGTAERGVWSLEPNEEARRRVVEQHIELFSAMHPAEPGTRITQLETPQEVPSLESFYGLES